MDVSTLLTSIESILKDTATIQNYCTAKYAKALTIFIGNDTKNAPNIEDFPAFVLHDIKIDRTLDRITYHIWIGIAVDNNEVTHVGNVYKYKGFVESKELKELLEAEICAKFGKVTFISSSQSDAFFPIFTDIVEFAVEYPISKRSSREPL